MHAQGIRTQGEGGDVASIHLPPGFRTELSVEGPRDQPRKQGQSYRQITGSSWRKAREER